MSKARKVQTEKEKKNEILHQVEFTGIHLKWVDYPYRTLWTTFF